MPAHARLVLCPLLKCLIPFAKALFNPHGLDTGPTVGVGSAGSGCSCHLRTFISYPLPPPCQSALFRQVVVQKNGIHGVGIQLRTGCSDNFPEFIRNQCVR